MAGLLPLWPFIGLLWGVVLVGIDPWIPNRRGRVFESRLASAPGDPVSLNAGLLARHALGSGIALALIAGLWLGGAELIKHLVLRLAAIWGTPLPLRLAGFLERVCDLGLMQRVGDGYRFTHRLLGQHIAARWQPRD